jgi:hypothetical protein
MEQWEIELKQNQAERIINIEKSLNYSPLGHILNDIEKGKRMPIGTITNGFKKIAEGKWRKVSEHGYNKETHERFAAGTLNPEQTKNLPKSSQDYHIAQKKLHIEAASKLDSKDYSDDEVMGGEKKHRYGNNTLIAYNNVVRVANALGWAKPMFIDPVESGNFYRIKIYQPDKDEILKKAKKVVPEAKLVQGRNVNKSVYHLYIPKNTSDKEVVNYTNFHFD